MFFNVGGLEVLVIAMIALIAVGPEQLPSVLRKAGKAMAQVRSMTMGLREEFMSGIDEVTDLADPKKWMGTGSETDPIVPRGYANSQNGGATSTSSDTDTDTADTSADTEPAEPQINEVARANAMRAKYPPPAQEPIEPSADADAEPEDLATSADDGEDEGSADEDDA